MEEAFGVLTFPFPLSLADQINRASQRSKARVYGSGYTAGGESTLSYVKPAVGFTLPSAGVTPAPSEKREILRTTFRSQGLDFGGTGFSL